MHDYRHQASAPCIVNEGILINKKDMLRALETLESVKYAYIVDDNVISQGEGVVVKVFSSQDTPTLVINGCLFLNIHSFNYLRFYAQDNGLTTIELVEDAKILQLISIEDDARRISKINREIFTSSRYDEEAPAELFDETDEDDRY